MLNAIATVTPRPDQVEPPLARFHAARRSAHLALIAWLRTDPAAADVALEIDDSVASWPAVPTDARP